MRYMTERDAVASTQPTERVRPRRRPASISIGHIAGIDIRVHATFLLLILLVVLGSEGKAVALWGNVAWLTALFASVVAHELAHSVVARRRGAIVRGIVLLPIGGVSQLERMPQKPADEFRVAVVGPLTSVAVGAGFGMLALALGDPLLPARLDGGPFLARLAWANLLLGGFNLLPAFPMDGGRLLRAVLERNRGALSATKIAARVGRTLAGGMVGVGLLWNPWLIFIGVFVWFGASAEEAATVVHARLQALAVSELSVPTEMVDGSTSCWHAAAVAADAGRRYVAVIDSGKFVGIASVDDLLAAPTDTPCRTVAKRVSTVGPSDRVDPDAMAAMAATGGEVVAVVDQDVVVGVLRMADVEHAAQGAPSGRRPGGRRESLRRLPSRSSGRP